MKHLTRAVNHQIWTEREYCSHFIDSLLPPMLKFSAPRIVVDSSEYVISHMVLHMSLKYRFSKTNVEIRKSNAIK